MDDDVVYGLGNSLTVRPNPLKVIRHGKTRSSAFFAKYDIQSSQPIGSGTYSICMKCRNRETSDSVAVKILTSHCDINVAQEVAALKLCQGPFVVRLIEVMTDEAYAYIVTELLEGGDLLQRAERSALTERELALVFGQIVRAVQHMHNMNVVHRDLKPENICFVSNSSAEVRVIDFGFAKCLTDHSETMSKKCYTLEYAAPEVLSSGQTYSKACDIWSIGVLMYTLMCGHSPFRNGLENLTQTQSIHVIADRIRRGSFDFDSSNWLKLSEPTKKLIKGLLHVNPSDRYTLDNIVDKDDHNHIKSEKLSNWTEPVKAIRCDINLVFKAQRETFRYADNAIGQPEQIIKKSISTTSIVSSRHSGSSNGGVLSRSSGHASYTDQNNRSTSTATISSDTTELFNNNDKFDATIVCNSSNLETNQNNNLDHVKRLSANRSQPPLLQPIEIEEDFHGFSTEEGRSAGEYAQKFQSVQKQMAANKKPTKRISPNKKRRSNIQIRQNYLKVSQCHPTSEAVDANDRGSSKRIANKTAVTVDPVDPYFQRSIKSGYVYGDYFNTSGLPPKRNRTTVNYKETDDDVDIKKRRIRAFMKGTTNSW